MKKELLLKEISDISKKHDIINQKTGGLFNIFKILNISTDEVKICRFIYELLDPSGSHYQGTVYLELFIDHVLNLDLSKDEYESIQVHREYLTKENRRIDIAIETKQRFIPVEVKIYAGDQNNQCSDYYKSAKNSNVYFLTLDGRSPYEYSAKGLNKIGDTYKEVTNISFDNHIRLWLIKCLEHKNTVRVGPIREILLQMLAVINNLINQGKEEEQMEISDKLLSSSENFKSAMEIKKALPLAKTQIMLNLFNSIKEELSNQGKEILDYRREEIEDYYNKSRKCTPVLAVKVKDLSDNLIAAISIEIDHRLFFYYSFMYYDDIEKCHKNKQISDVKKTNLEEYQRFFNAAKPILKSQERYTAYTFYWECIRYDNREYNFKTFTDPCIDLLNNNQDVARSISSTILTNIKDTGELL